MTIAFQRKLYTEIFGGIDACYAPFIATTHMRKKRSPLFEDILPENNNDVPLIPQILGNNSDDFRFFASRISAMGYEEVNWNIGCPYPTITKKKKGSGILPYPDKIRSFLENVCQDDTYTLTVKMRLGLEDNEEGLRVMEVLNEYPIGNVTIHGRLGVQKYSGTVDLDAFELLLKTSRHEVIYNGDIFTVEDYKKIQSRFPDIDGFMLGRGALRDMFLPSTIKGVRLSDSERLDKLQQYHQAFYDYYDADMDDTRLFINKMKEFWVYASYQVDGDGIFLKKIRQCQSLDDYKWVCDSLFHA